MSFLLIPWWDQEAPIGRMERQNNFVFIGPNGRAYTSIGLKDEPSTGNIIQGGPASTPYAVGNQAGFLWIAGTNGTPIGVPIGGGMGKCPITIDVVNNVLYFYNAGLWRAAGGGGGGSSPLTIDAKTSTYTAVSGDLGKVINCTANTFTVNLTSASTVGAGWYAWVWNTGSGLITIDPAGSETINGNTTIVLRASEGVQIVSDGVNWIAGDQRYVSMFAGNVGTVNARPNAAGTNSIALGLRAAASSTNSTAIGANAASSGSTTSGGTGAVALGGSYASGSDSTAMSISTNNSFVGARAQNAIAGGNNANADGQGSISLGSFTEARATGAVTIGDTSSSTQQQAHALGHRASSAVYGKQAYASGTFNITGGAQRGQYVLRRSSSGSSVELTTNGSASGGGTPNQVVVSTFSSIAFTGIVVADEGTSGTSSAAWKIEGLIRQDFAPSTTVLLASTVSVISNIPGWTLSLSANTTTGALQVNFTGGPSTTYAVAVIETAEVDA